MLCCTRSAMVSLGRLLVTIDPRLALPRSTEANKRGVLVSTTVDLCSTCSGSRKAEKLRLFTS
jgi:hypothetical protein